MGIKVYTFMLNFRVKISSKWLRSGLHINIMLRMFYGVEIAHFDWRTNRHSHAARADFWQIQATKLRATHIYIPTSVELSSFWQKVST